MNDIENPKLRLIDTQVIAYEGENYLLLRDPLMLTDKSLLVPQPMIPALALCDGSHNISSLRGALALRYGLFLTTQRIEEFLKALDDAFLLENARFRQAVALARTQFHQAAFRQPASAGQSYPDDPKALGDLLQSYIDQRSQASHARSTRPLNGNGKIRGIISPHIDYERGGPVYAQVWSEAAEAVQAAELAIIFGTDHFSEGRPITLTRQNYATPFGVLPNDRKIVEELAGVLGIEAAFEGELHHRREHSIELAAVWMHYIRGGKPITTIPILTGSLALAGDQAGGPDLEAFLRVLRRAMQGRKTIVVAAGDLAHVGPAFDTEPVNPEKLLRLKNADDQLVAAMCQGDAEGFYGAIRSVQDQNNVCGVSPIYLTLRLLAPLTGQSQGYAVCPADVQQTSVVTICGVTLQ